MNDSLTLLQKDKRRLQSVIWGRRLARTKAHNFLALVPREARRRDLICIISGCSVPVVLRKRRKESGYAFVGKSYVHAMMDGEASEIKTQMKTEYEKFELH